MGNGILLIVILTLNVAVAHASLSDDIKEQNLVFTQTQYDVNYYLEKYESLKDNQNTWDDIREFNRIEIEKDYAIQQRFEARSTLHDLYSQRSAEIKEARETKEATTSALKIITIEDTPDFGMNNLVGVNLSKSCEISENCLNYSDLIHLDSSNQEVSGKFIIINNDTRRDTPPLKDSWRWYDYDNTIRIIVDPPHGMAERMKMVTIMPNLDNYILKNDMFDGESFEFLNGTKITNQTKAISYQYWNQTSDSSRIIFHDRYINNCSIAKINVNNWEVLLNDTITYLRSDCDAAYTSFDEREEIPIIPTEIDVLTSPNWVWLKEFEAIKTSCVITRTCEIDINHSVKLEELLPFTFLTDFTTPPIVEDVEVCLARGVIQKC